MKELIAIQGELKAPKGQRNNFGNYNYRSCEDILEAVKPLCIKYNCLLTLSDEMIMLGDRFYVKATATITSGDKSFSVSAYARESEVKKGMDASQITGSASSYARKYALNGLFCIDDTKDADTMDNTAQPHSAAPKQSIKQMDHIQKATLKDLTVALEKIGSEGAGKAVTAINTALGNINSRYDDVEHLINRCKKTIEKG